MKNTKVMAVCCTVSTDSLLSRPEVCLVKLSLDIHGNVIKLNHDILSSSYEYTRHEQKMIFIVKLRQGSGKDRQGMALKAKGLKA